MSQHCLNCGNPVHDAYCESCGQKTSTHRFSLSHVFTHDFIHGIFHLDKGCFFTIKELVIRPGHSIREFVAGKRVKHFNYFTLLLLLITADLLLQGLSPVDTADILRSLDSNNNKTMIDVLEKASKEYPKLFVLATIPVYALSSWIFFRKAKHNFAEHLVLNAYKGAGEMLVAILPTVAMLIIYDLPTLRIITVVVSFLLFIYAIRFYIQYFSAYSYSRAGLFLRSFGAAMSFNIIVFIAMVVAGLMKT